MKTREHFNPRAPCGARRQPLPLMPLMYYFNPRAPCGARRQRGQLDYHGRGFQPTRPLRGATIKEIGDRAAKAFQPTRPLRGATGGCQPGKNHSTISTHAPLAGRDEHRVDYLVRQLNFNPRAPCGARPSGPRSHRIMVEFQPTRPLRGATFFFRVSLKAALISTHAPLAGRD